MCETTKLTLDAAVELCDDDVEKRGRIERQLAVVYNDTSVRRAHSPQMCALPS